MRATGRSTNGRTAAATGWRSSSPSSTTSTCCAAPPTSTSGSSGLAPRPPRLAVTLGDPRGIGPEVMEKALALGPLDAEVVIVGSGVQARRSLPPEDAGRIAGQAVEEAVRLALSREVDAIVTGPVHKHALHLAGFRYPGLTEFLSHLAGDVDVAMMLAAGPLRVVLVTTHIPLKDVPAAVTTARLVACGRLAEPARPD